MQRSTTLRRLFKSRPEHSDELTEDVLDRLGEDGEIRITRVDRESTVAWEGDRVSGTVELPTRRGGIPGPPPPMPDPSPPTPSPQPGPQPVPPTPDPTPPDPGPGGPNPGPAGPNPGPAGPDPVPPTPVPQPPAPQIRASARLDGVHTVAILADMLDDLVVGRRRPDARA